jgi:hypothetical protein
MNGGETRFMVRTFVPVTQDKFRFSTADWVRTNQLSPMKQDNCLGRWRLTDNSPVILDLNI